MRLLPALLAAVACLSLGACQTKPKEEETQKLAFAGERANLPKPDVMSFPGPRGSLAGRTIRVSSPSDLILAKNEVVLTFDDGPVPGKTPAILAALDRAGVKATFLMVGQMARSYPALVREVAARGHTIGTHTQDHKNLAGIGFDAAIAQIEAGRRSVEAALGPSRNRASGLFRFPYLAETAALRKHLAAHGMVPIGVTVDSKDYFVSSPDQVRSRTLATLSARGSGIILFHDLHKRTADMLPAFLSDLHARGFKVVHLVPASRAAESLIVAALSGDDLPASNDLPVLAYAPF
ncbi:MAG: polysaccharide deacetylase family protein [Rhizobiaceae bacterium]|nr:polysaccharide deacetylase family protein [Rhizobiaceae bacterium]